MAGACRAPRVAGTGHRGAGTDRAQTGHRPGTEPASGRTRPRAAPGKSRRCPRNQGRTRPSGGGTRGAQGGFICFEIGPVDGTRGAQGKFICFEIGHGGGCLDDGASSSRRVVGSRSPSPPRAPSTLLSRSWMNPSEGVIASDRCRAGATGMRTARAPWKSSGSRGVDTECAAAGAAGARAGGPAARPARRRSRAPRGTRACPFSPGSIPRANARGPRSRPFAQPSRPPFEGAGWRLRPGRQDCRIPRGSSWRSGRSPRYLHRRAPLRAAR